MSTTNCSADSAKYSSRKKSASNRRHQIPHPRPSRPRLNQPRRQSLRTSSAKLARLSAISSIASLLKSSLKASPTSQHLSCSNRCKTPKHNNPSKNCSNNSAKMACCPRHNPMALPRQRRPSQKIPLLKIQRYCPKNVITRLLNRHTHKVRLSPEARSGNWKSSCRNCETIRRLPQCNPKVLRKLHRSQTHLQTPLPKPSPEIHSAAATARPLHRLRPHHPRRLPQIQITPTIPPPTVVLHSQHQHQRQILLRSPRCHRTATQVVIGRSLNHWNNFFNNLRANQRRSQRTPTLRSPPIRTRIRHRLHSQFLIFFAASFRTPLCANRKICQLHSRWKINSHQIVRVLSRTPTNVHDQPQPRTQLPRQNSGTSQTRLTLFRSKPYHNSPLHNLAAIALKMNCRSIRALVNRSDSCSTKLGRKPGNRPKSIGFRHPLKAARPPALNRPLPHPHPGRRKIIVAEQTQCCVY